MKQQMLPNNFPISLEEFKAELHFKEINKNIAYNINGLKVETFILNHPSPTLTFKITEGNASFIYMTDNELNIDHTQERQDDSYLRSLNQDLIAFVKTAITFFMIPCMMRIQCAIKKGGDIQVMFLLLSLVSWRISKILSYFIIIRITMILKLIAS